MTEKSNLPALLSGIPFVQGKSRLELDGSVYEIDPKSIQNALLMVEHAAALNGVFIYDMFADDIMVAKCPPWENSETFHPHRLVDPDDTIRLRAWLETRHIKVGANDSHSVIIAAARRNSINPPKDYFETLNWDKVPRLDKWLFSYCGAEYQNEEYLKLVGSMWLIGAVARIYQPGCKFDTALILEGKPYAGKSEAFRILATFNGQDYFCDQNLDFHKVDSLLTLQGKIIFEMAELANFKRAENEDVKSFVSRQVDEYRPPYGRKVSKRPRMFVIGGSVNPNGGYFKDPTGNRRYWPVACGTIDLEKLKDDKDQLWAEAIYRFKMKERYWLLDSEYELARIEQEFRLEEDALTDDIQKAIDDITVGRNLGFRTNDILNKMGFEPCHKTNMIANRVKSYLTASGYREERPRIQHRQVRLWFKAGEEQVFD